MGSRRSHISRAPVRAAVAFLIASSLLVVAGSAQSAPERREATVGVITFGASLSLTGGLAAESRTVKDGYDFMIRHLNRRGGITINGKRYRFAIKYYDDESNANTSVRLYEKLIVQDKVKLLLGPYSSGVTLAASTVSEKHRLPMVVAHAATSSIYERGFKYLFATLNSVDQYSGPILRMAAGLRPKPKTIALIAENALFPQAGINAAEAQAKVHGFEVIYKGSYPTGTPDFSTLLATIKDRKPDILIAGGYTGDMIQLMRQSAELKLTVPLTGFLLGPTVPGFIDSLRRDAEYLLEPVQWSANMNRRDQLFGWTAGQYAKLFQKEVGYFPDYHPPQSSAAILVYYHALRKAQSLDPQKVRAQIAKTNIQTFYGPVRFNAKGQNIAKSMAVIQVQGGKPWVIYPERFAQRKLIYPAPSR